MALLPQNFIKDILDYKYHIDLIEDSKLSVIHDKSKFSYTNLGNYPHTSYDHDNLIISLCEKNKSLDKNIFTLKGTYSIEQTLKYIKQDYHIENIIITNQHLITLEDQFKIINSPDNQHLLQKNDRDIIIHIGSNAIEDEIIILSKYLDNKYFSGLNITDDVILKNLYKDFSLPSNITKLRINSNSFEIEFIKSNYAIMCDFGTRRINSILDEPFHSIREIDYKKLSPSGNLRYIEFPNIIIFNNKLINLPRYVEVLEYDYYDDIVDVWNDELERDIQYSRHY